MDQLSRKREPSRGAAKRCRGGASWKKEVDALEAALRASGDDSEVEELLRRGALTAQRLDALAAIADRLANRVRARVIAGCLERLGANPSS